VVEEEILEEAEALQEEDSMILNVLLVEAQEEEALVEAEKLQTEILKEAQEVEVLVQENEVLEVEVLALEDLVQVLQEVLVQENEVLLIVVQVLEDLVQEEVLVLKKAVLAQEVEVHLGLRVVLEGNLLVEDVDSFFI
jgi:hypothetical protein